MNTYPHSSFLKQHVERHKNFVEILYVISQYDGLALVGQKFAQFWWSGSLLHQMVSQIICSYHFIQPI